jgi:hypothetical protein
MSEEVKMGPSWMCRLGHHHYHVESDGNPENPTASHLECDECAKNKDIRSPGKYTPLDPHYLGGRGIGNGH